MAMAQSGYNGNNETQIGFSTSLSVSIYDEYGNPIDISNTSQYIDVWIARDLSLQPPMPNYVNTTLDIGRGPFIPIVFNVSAANASVHLELSPVVKTIGYVVLQKFGNFPVYNKTYKNFDNWQLLCPNGKLISIQ